MELGFNSQFSQQVNTMGESCGDNFLCINDLSLKYNEFTVFKNISFNVRKNKITTLVGPSGTGKSSLLHSIIRLTDFNPNVKADGSVTLCGLDVLKEKDVKSVRQKIGLVFQKPNPFPVSIYKNLDIPLKENSRLNRTERQEKIEEVLKLVGLWSEVKDRLKKSATALSGGQQQRLCIARSLVLNPELLLLDEPTSSLDPVSEGRIEELMLELKKDRTLLLVTHNMPQMRKVADDIVLLWPENKSSVILKNGCLKDILAQKNDNSLARQYLLT